MGHQRQRQHESAAAMPIVTVLSGATWQGAKLVRKLRWGLQDEHRAIAPENNGSYGVAAARLGYVGSMTLRFAIERCLRQIRTLSPLVNCWPRCLDRSGGHLFPQPPVGPARRDRRHEAHDLGTRALSAAEQ
jgi:hypothetical protein